MRETAVLLDIDQLLDRKPGQLSGGQRQRVAMGRALVRRPQAFLLDEPLSNLDAKLRTQVRGELKRLHRELPVTSIYVTHDQVEAMTLGDRICVMSSGEVQQIGTTDEIYNQPEQEVRRGTRSTTYCYRVGDDTPFVQSLIRAAEAGKQVACVIELNARFDEERNLHWSRELEKVGAHVVFGLTGLKTHSKTALVVRKEEGGIRCYAHVATGNYHTRTARLYEDVGLLTADPAVTGDVVTLFHFLTGRSRTPSFTNLVVAPMHMRAAFTRLIEREISNHEQGRPARIVCKMNQVEDPEICSLLSRASQAGVPVDLVVRGLCSLAPGVPGVTENIRIRSVVGRFLEHSRIFHFAAGSEDPLDGDFLIGSADWMYRNLSERVEAAVPIVDRRLRGRLWEILEVCLQDRRNAWQMQPDGSYVQLRPDRTTRWAPRARTRR